MKQVDSQHGCIIHDRTCSPLLETAADAKEREDEGAANRWVHGNGGQSAMRTRDGGWSERTYSEVDSSTASSEHGGGWEVWL